MGVCADITRQKLAEQRLRDSNDQLHRRELELFGALESLRESHEHLSSVQMQLVQLERLHSVGRLAAGVAHEVKTPLAITSMGIDYLASNPPPDDGNLPTVLKNMREAVKRANTAINGLLDFSAPRKINAVPGNLNSVIERSLRFVKHELMRCHITLKLDLSRSLPPCLLDADKIEQVFVNLLMNAIESMPSGGQLVIRTHAHSPHNNGDQTAPDSQGDDMLVVAEIDDAGLGISPENLARAFDPFFTTKPEGKAPGMGLTVAKTIMDLHGGTIKVHNRAKGGTRVAITFKTTS